MKSEHDIQVVDISNEMKSAFLQKLDYFCEDAKQQMYKIQYENHCIYNLWCRQAHKYQLNDLVAIKWTQFSSGQKLKQKFLGQYKGMKVKQNGTYDVAKCDFFDGLSHASICTKHMKPWYNNITSITWYMLRFTFLCFFSFLFITKIFLLLFF